MKLLYNYFILSKSNRKKNQIYIKMLKNYIYFKTEIDLRDHLVIRQLAHSSCYFTDLFTISPPQEGRDFCSLLIPAARAVPDT